MATKTILLRQFNGGMAADPRDPASNLNRYAVNFDILTNPYKITPHHDSENGDNAASTSQKQNFCIGNWLPSSTNDWRLFSLGVKSGTGLAEVLMKTLGTGGASDLSDNTWTAPANNQSASGNTSLKLFTFYKTTGKIYGAAAGTHIWAFTLDGSTPFDDSQHSLTYTNIANGLVHSKDGILYVPYDNKIARKNGSSAWEDAVLTLPDYLYVTSVCEYGNYLAIMAAPLSGVGATKVYLWDRDASLATLPEVIDWGEGVGKVLETLDGTLIGISISGGLGNADGQAVFKSKVTFKYYTGAGAQTFAIYQGVVGDSLISSKQRVDKRLLFMMSVTIDGTIYAGTWSVGRNGTGNFTIVQESTLNNDTAAAVGDTLSGFIKVGDYLIQAYTTIGDGLFKLTKTNDQSSYTATSIYQTTINEGMAPGDKIEKKQLISAGLMYEALPAAGQAVLKYRVDAGSWTTIFTETTDGLIYTEPLTNAGGTQFTAGKEYEFRAESTGGAEITGILYKYSVIPTNV